MNIVYDWSINLLFGVVDISQGALCLSPCVVASLIQCPKLQRKYLLNAGVLSRSVVTLLTTIHQPLTQPSSQWKWKHQLRRKCFTAYLCCLPAQFEGRAPANPWAGAVSRGRKLTTFPHLTSPSLSLNTELSSVCLHGHAAECCSAAGSFIHCDI